jgi:iron-sulfur cluster assembly accessory protein
MIEVTESAVRQLQALVGTAGEKALRIGIAKGGCSGLQYEMRLGEARPGDTVIARDGVKFVVDKESAQLLRGSTLDYRDVLSGAGFQIINPNAARSCGCGSSFEPARPL